MKKKIVLPVLVAALVLGLAGISIGESTFRTEAESPLPPRAALAKIDDLEALSSNAPLGTAERKSLDVLKGQISSYGRSDEGSVGKIDVASARPFVIPGGKGFLWVTKTTDGGICVFLPQLASGMSGGFTAACNPLADFNASGIAGLSPIGEDEFLGYSIQPPGVAPPVVKSSDGATRSVPVRSSVAIAVLGDGEALKSGGLTLASDDIPSPDDLPMVPAK